MQLSRRARGPNDRGEEAEGGRQMRGIYSVCNIYSVMSSPSAMPYTMDTNNEKLTYGREMFGSLL